MDALPNFNSHLTIYIILKVGENKFTGEVVRLVYFLTYTVALERLPFRILV